MSGANPSVRPARRVRHDARDALGVMVFTAAASSTVTVIITLLTRLAGLGK